jgi:hypothetical protein
MAVGAALALRAVSFRGPATSRTDATLAVPTRTPRAHRVVAHSQDHAGRAVEHLHVSQRAAGESPQHGDDRSRHAVPSDDGPCANHGRAAVVAQQDDVRPQNLGEGSDRQGPTGRGQPADDDRMAGGVGRIPCRSVAQVDPGSPYELAHGRRPATQDGCHLGVRAGEGHA